MIDPVYSIWRPAMGFSFDTMSSDVADEFFKLFVANIPLRIRVLKSSVRRLLGQSLAEDSLLLSAPHLVDWLQQMVDGRVLTEAEQDELLARGPNWLRRSDVGDVTLTERDFCAGVDVGIFLAESLRSRSAKLGWHRDKSKPYVINYQRPVLGGFNNNVSLDPILIGSSFAWRALRKEPLRLPEAIDFWSANA